MSDELQYKLTIGVSDGTDVEELEEFLQTILLDLYENGGVEAIKVTKDGYSENVTEDIDGLLNSIENVSAEEIRRAADSVKRLEDMDDG